MPALSIGCRRRQCFRLRAEKRGSNGDKGQEEAPRHAARATRHRCAGASSCYGCAPATAGVPMLCLVGTQSTAMHARGNASVTGCQRGCARLRALGQRMYGWISKCMACSKFMQRKQSQNASTKYSHAGSTHNITTPMLHSTPAFGSPQCCNVAPQAQRSMQCTPNNTHGSWEINQMNFARMPVRFAPITWRMPLQLSISPECAGSSLEGERRGTGLRAWQAPGTT